MYFKIIYFKEHKVTATTPHPHHNPILLVKMLSGETVSGDNVSASASADGHLGAHMAKGLLIDSLEKCQNSSFPFSGGISPS